MEKKLYDLTIDPALESMLPPLTEEETETLEQSILNDGCIDPIIVWNNTIIDGHNRYRICRQYDIPFAIEEKEFDSDRDAAAWMLSYQMGRRNLSKYDRARLALKYEGLYRTKAVKRKRSGKKDESGLTANDRKTDTALGVIAGLSRDTICKVRKMDGKVTPDMERELKKGRMSINAAYNKLFPKDDKNLFPKDDKLSSVPADENTGENATQAGLQQYTDDELKYELFKRNGFWGSNEELYKSAFMNTFDSYPERNHLIIPDWECQVHFTLHQIISGFCQNIETLVEVTDPKYLTENEIAVVKKQLSKVTDDALEALETAIEIKTEDLL